MLFMNKKLHFLYITLLTIVVIISFFLLLYNGYSYYTSPLEKRFYHEQHNLLKSSGLIGHGIGILGTLMIIFGVSIYMIRKRVKAFAKLGLLKYWLEFHIFLCTLGPILVLFHTSFKFGGIVSISFWSMVFVVLSGIIGRFIYIQIPRTIQGQELSINEINSLNDSINIDLIKIYSFNESENFTKEIDNELKKLESKKGISAIVGLITSRIKISIALYNIEKKLEHQKIDLKLIKEIIKLLKRKLLLSRRIITLNSMQNLFKHWHVAHLPFAIIMMVIMLVHVIVAIVFGYRWIF